MDILFNPVEAVYSPIGAWLILKACPPNEIHFHSVSETSAGIEIQCHKIINIGPS